MSLIFITRPSALARWQTQWVIEALKAQWPEIQCEEKVVTTKGDRILNQPLPEIGGKGLFTHELEVALVSGAVQLAVHSLKDLPVEECPGLVIGAIPKRGEIRDVLISARGYSLENLPPSAKVGTSSLRRSAQVKALRPDVSIESLRGNVDTRIRKAMDGLYDAIILAGAGVVRLGLQEYISQWLPLETMLPAPGQGALAVQCCTADKQTRAYLRSIDDKDTRLSTQAERAFLSALGGGCSLPVAAFAEVHDGLIELKGLAAAEDGSKVIRCSASGRNPLEVGLECAKIALSQGAKELIQ